MFPPKTVEWVVEPPFALSSVDDALEPFSVNMPQGVTKRVQVDPTDADPSVGVASFTVTVVAELSTITPEVSLVPGAPGEPPSVQMVVNSMSVAVEGEFSCVVAVRDQALFVSSGVVSEVMVQLNVTILSKTNLLIFPSDTSIRASGPGRSDGTVVAGTSVTPTSLFCINVIEAEPGQATVLNFTIAVNDTTWSAGSEDWLTVIDGAKTMEFLGEAVVVSLRYPFVPEQVRPPSLADLEAEALLRPHQPLS